MHECKAAVMMTVVLTINLAVSFFIFFINQKILWGDIVKYIHHSMFFLISGAKSKCTDRH